MVTAKEKVLEFAERQRNSKERIYIGAQEVLDFIRQADDEQALIMLDQYGFMRDGDYGYGQWDWWEFDD